MSVVVTGAAGFLGGHLVDALAAAGYDVVAVDRATPRTPPPVGARSLRADVLDAVTADAVRDASAVFHLAGRPGVRDSGPEVEAARHRDNVLATAAVLAAAPSGVPVVVTSSSSVYGGAAARPSREDDDLRPRGGYARSKVAVEELCARRREAGGAVAVVRPFTVAGPGQRADMAIATWTDAVLAGTPVRLLGGARRSRDITDVADVVRALVALADLGLGRTVNIGTGTAHTHAQILDAVCAAVGRPALVLDEPAGADEAVATLADTTLCERLLGWRPVTDLGDVVRRQVASLDAGRALALPV